MEFVVLTSNRMRSLESSITYCLRIGVMLVEKESSILCSSISMMLALIPSSTIQYGDITHIDRVILPSNIHIRLLIVMFVTGNCWMSLYHLRNSYWFSIPILPRHCYNNNDTNNVHSALDIMIVTKERECRLS